MPDAPEKKRQRRLRFSLRSFVLVVLLVGSGVGLWRRWEPWALLAEIGDGETGVTRATLSRTGQHLLVVQSDDTATVWDLSSDESLATIRASALGVAAFSPSGNSILLSTPVARTESGMTTTAFVCGVFNEDRRSSLVGHRAELRQGRFLNEGKQIVTVDYEAECRIWDAHSGECRRVFRLPEGSRILNVSEDGSVAAVRSSTIAGSIELWELCSGEKLRDLNDNVASFMKAELSLDGKWLLSVGVDGLAKLWDCASGRCVRTYRHLGDITLVGWGPNKTVFFTLSGKTGPVMKVWHPGNENPISTIATGVGGEPLWADLMADNRRIIAAYDDHRVRVWDTTLGACVHQFDFHVDLASFSWFETDADGTIFIAAWDMGVQVWHRRRPEWWWGIFWLWETWAVMVFGVALIWSLHRDRRRFREHRGE